MWQLKRSLVNDEGQFSGYSFNRAVFAIYMNLELSDGKVETFKRGSFIVCKKPAVDEEINLTLLDYMSKTDKSYESNLIFPCTVGEVLRDCCQACGIALGDAVFTNDDFRVIQKPTSTTFPTVMISLLWKNRRLFTKMGLTDFSFPQMEGRPGKPVLTPMGMQYLISCMPLVFRQNGSTQEV